MGPCSGHTWRGTGTAGAAPALLRLANCSGFHLCSLTGPLFLGGQFQLQLRGERAPPRPLTSVSILGSLYYGEWPLPFSLAPSHLTRSQLPSCSVLLTHHVKPLPLLSSLCPSFGMTWWQCPTPGLHPACPDFPWGPTPPPQPMCLRDSWATAQGLFLWLRGPGLGKCEVRQACQAVGKALPPGKAP